MLTVSPFTSQPPERQQEVEFSYIYSKRNTMKTCAKCKQNKDLIDFMEDKTIKCGYRSYCRECQRIKSKEDSRKRYKNGKRKQYNVEKANDISLKYKKWRLENINIISKKANIKYKTDLNFRLKHILRARIQKALILGCKRTSSTELLGCNIEEYKQYLESKFTKGMNWNNYGRKKGCWNIDHIKPCSSFDLNDIEQQKQCFNYINTQPMWWEENLKKGTRV